MGVTRCAESQFKAYSCFLTQLGIGNVVLTAMMEKYRLGGLRQVSDPAIFRLPPFKAMGELRAVSQRFGGTGELRQTMTELQRRLYAA